MTVQNFEVLNTTGKLIEAKSAWFQWDAVETDPDQMKGEFHGYKVCRAVEIPCPTCPTISHFIQDKLKISINLSLDTYKCFKLIQFCISYFD